jgi:hypothetical protein
MVDHVVHAEVRESQRRVIVVELQRGDAGRIRLEPEHENIAHQTHVIGDVLRDAIGGARNVRLIKRRTPALQLALLPGLVDTLLDIADRVEVLVEFALIRPADLAFQVARISQHGIEHALVTLLHLIFEEPVESQRGIEFQWCGRCGR